MPKPRAISRGGLTQHPLTNDPERCAEKVADRVIEKAELVGPLPAAVLNVSAIGEQVTPQRGDQREGMLRHRMHGVVADIGDCDVVCVAVGDVDDVITGSGDGNHRSFGSRCSVSARSGTLLVMAIVASLSLCATSLAAVTGYSCHVCAEGRTTHVGLQRRAIEEHDVLRLRARSRTHPWIDPVEWAP